MKEQDDKQQQAIEKLSHIGVEATTVAIIARSKYPRSLFILEIMFPSFKPWYIVRSKDRIFVYTIKRNFEPKKQIMELPLTAVLIKKVRPVLGTRVKVGNKNALVSKEWLPYLELVLIP